MGGFSRGGTDSRPAEDSRYGLDRVRVLDSRAKPAGEGLSPRGNRGDTILISSYALFFVLDSAVAGYDPMPL